MSWWYEYSYQILDTKPFGINGKHIYTNNTPQLGYINLKQKIIFYTSCAKSKGRNRKHFIIIAILLSKDP